MDGARKIVADLEPYNLPIFDVIRDGLVRCIRTVWWSLNTYLQQGLGESKHLQWTSHTRITMQCKVLC